MELVSIFSRFFENILSSPGQDGDAMRRAYEIDGKIRRELGVPNAELNAGIAYALAQHGTIQLHYGNGAQQEINISNGLDEAELVAIRASLGKDVLIENADVTMVEGEGPGRSVPAVAPSEAHTVEVCGVRG